MPELDCTGTPTPKVYPGNDNIFLPDHGFSTGDAVTYRGTGIGLNDGATYYVIRVDANVIRLATSYLKAVGYGGSNNGTPNDSADDFDPIAVSWVALSRSGSLSATHSLAQELTGLEDGRAYYITDVDAATAGVQVGLATTRANADAGTAVVVGNYEAVTLTNRNFSATTTIQAGYVRGVIHYRCGGRRPRERARSAILRLDSAPFRLA